MTMREQLQSLVDRWNDVANTCHEDGEQWTMSVCADELETILATPDPAVTLCRGWLCKDHTGIYWQGWQPKWNRMLGRFDQDQLMRVPVNDPWPDHPNGGPDCCMEVG